MKELLFNKYFQIALRLVIGIVFIWASVYKLFNPADFAKAVVRYEMLPIFLVNIVAITLPYVEFLIGIFLVLGVYKKGASLLAVISLAVFTVALITALARGLDIGCGCFSLEETSSKSDILIRIFQDLLMIAGALIIYFNPENYKPEEQKEN